MKTTASKETSIEVCHGSVCSDSGGSLLAREFTEKGINVVVGNCRGLCSNAPLVHVNNNTIFEATSKKVLARIKDIASGKFFSNL